jgi:hypothetical protein
MCSSQKQVAEWMREKVKWDLYFTMIQHVGGELNSRKLRFDKSDLFEQAIDRFSGGEIRWADQTGYDHVITSSGVKLEMKYSTGCLYGTRDGRRGFGKKRPFVGGLRLTNTLGGGSSRTSNRTYDYLLISDVRAIALVSYEKIKDYIIANDDSMQLPNNKLASTSIEYICTPADWDLVHFEQPDSYAKQKRQMQAGYLNAFCDSSRI